MNSFTSEELYEIQERLEKIQRKMLKQIGKLEEVIDQLGDENSRAYILDHLKILVSDNHSFLTRDRSISDMINSLQEYEEGHYDEEE
ncbi:MAG: hypothetical protein KA314_04825 [Chloroflexi bacterium]|nr:hypothetical protein [Chloroflexota bacterium]